MEILAELKRAFAAWCHNQTTSNSHFHARRFYLEGFSLPSARQHQQP